jgi:ubiquitin carboxyl-terminal hydrolase 36/42
MGQGDPEDQFIRMLDMLSDDMGEAALKIFHSVFDTRLRAAITCGSCGHSREPTFSHTRSFIVPLPRSLNGKSLEAFMASNFTDELGIPCDKCHSRKRVHKITSITSPADVITIQLNRAHWDGSITNTRISIPELLNLSPLAQEESPRFSHKYRLLATVCHMGGNGAGHYICYARGPNGSWKEFDDSNVSPSSAQEAVSGKHGVKPVLLYYQRISPTSQPETPKPGKGQK